MSSATDGFIDFFQNLEKLLETSAYKMFCVIHNMVSFRIICYFMELCHFYYHRTKNEDFH